MKSVNTLLIVLTLFIVKSAMLKSCLEEKELEKSFKEMNAITLQETIENIPIFHHSSSTKPLNPPGSRCSLSVNSLRYLRDLSSCPWNYHYSYEPDRYPRYVLTATLKQCCRRKSTCSRKVKKQKSTKRDYKKPKQCNYCYNPLVENQSRAYCLSLRNKGRGKIRFDKFGECQSFSVKFTAFYRNATNGCFYHQPETTVLGFGCVLRQTKQTKYCCS